MSILKNSRHLQIPLKDIELAIQNSENPIGHGGYGEVYKGELFISGRKTTVAVKKLNAKSWQGLKEFLTEIQLLSGQHHKNLITLLGYCDEGNHKSLVYEYAANGSLDFHLRNKNKILTWRKRLEICLDAARGLNHLHSHSRKKQTIIHRDVKSANILLDDNWVAKISDLGLSKLNNESSGESIIVSNACGTPGYCDPEYMNGILKKEYDVYSFGIVLFEVLCGRLCSVLYKDGFLLSGQSAMEFYKLNKINEIMDPFLRDQMSSYSINKFSEVAYKCLLKDERQRPSMNRVVKELEELLLFHDIELASVREVGPDSSSYASEPIRKLRYEKVRRIFQRFDVNRDGVLNREELANFFIVTNPLVTYSDGKIHNKIDKVFHLFGTSTNDGNVLTCDGMLRAYDDHVVDNLNDHFDLLRLDFKTFDDHDDSFRTTERYEKVKRILQRFDINKDRCLNRQELASFLMFNNPQDRVELTKRINNIFRLYGEFIDGEKGLTYDGLFWVYGYGIDSLDIDFEKLHLDLNPFDENEAALRHEKVRRIFQRFDVNEDGGLNREELSELLVVTTPDLKDDEEKLKLVVVVMSSLFKEFINGEKGLTCDGLLHNYEHGIDNLDDHVEMLRLEMKPLDDSEAASRTRQRSEKVRTIFEQLDLNKDGGLNKEELTSFLLLRNPHFDSTEELTSYTDKVFRWYCQFIDGERGLTYDGLLRIYDHGINSLDADFERLELFLKTLTENEAASRRRDRYRKVQKIFKKFDLNGDGGLSKEEMASYFAAVYPGIKHNEELMDSAINANFQFFRAFVDGVTGLSCDGLMESYDYGDDSLDAHYELLNLR